MPLVIEVESADIITSVISLKAEAETALGTTLKVTLFGAAEAHLLAPELAAAKIGVVVAPPRPFPGGWEERRMCVFTIYPTILRTRRAADLCPQPTGTSAVGQGLSSAPR